MNCWFAYACCIALAASFFHAAVPVREVAMLGALFAVALCSGPLFAVVEGDVSVVFDEVAVFCVLLHAHSSVFGMGAHHGAGTCTIPILSFDVWLHGEQGVRSPTSGAGQVCS